VVVVGFAIRAVPCAPWEREVSRIAPGVMPGTIRHYGHGNSEGFLRGNTIPNYKKVAIRANPTDKKIY
jgi:hypothetical protein